jgi:primase-polymerase (primpol)-like protein
MAQPIRPQALAVRPEGIPKALRAIPRWVLWRYVSRQQADGQARWTKVPYSVEGGLAAVNNAETWSTFDSALAAPKRDSAYDGLGIILTDRKYFWTDIFQAIFFEIGACCRSIRAFCNCARRRR